MRDPLICATAYIDDVVATQRRHGFEPTISDEEYRRAVAMAAEAVAELTGTPAKANNDDSATTNGAGGKRVTR